MPPSPVLMTLRGWNEKQAMSPCGLPIFSHCAVPEDLAADGAGRVLDDGGCARARASTMAARSQGMPIWCTHRMARVFGVIAASMQAGSMLKVTGSMSMNTGVGAAVARPTLAVAMKEWLTVMTSSPGSTPTREQRQMQGRGAVGNRDRVVGADVRREFLLEGRDLGALGDPAGQDDAARGLGLALVHHRLDDRDHYAAIRSLFARHHSTRRDRPSSRSMVERKPSFSLAFSVQASRRETGLTLALGAVFGLELAAHDAQQRGGQVVEAGFDAARDVEHFVGDVGFERQDVRARDVFDVDEVHRGLAIAEDQRRLSGRDAVHPADQHFGVACRAGPCAGRRR